MFCIFPITCSPDPPSPIPISHRIFGSLGVLYAPQWVRHVFFLYYLRRSPSLTTFNSDTLILSGPRREVRSGGNSDFKVLLLQTCVALWCSSLRWAVHLVPRSLGTFLLEDRDKWAKLPSKHRSCTLELTSGVHLGNMEIKWRNRGGEMVPSEKSRILVVPCYQIFCCCFSQKPMSFHQELLKHSDQPKVGTRQGFNLVQKLQTYEVGLSSDSHNAHSFRGHLTSPNTLRWSPELLVLFCIKDHGSPVLGNQASHFIPCALLSLLRAL